jgi:hypothetical protein
MIDFEANRLKASADRDRPFVEVANNPSLKQGQVGTGQK